MKFLPFEEARLFARSLGLKNVKNWRRYCNSGKKPIDIPTTPERSYGKEWINWADWLGTRNVSSRNMKYRPFNEARKYVHSLGLKTIEEWKEFCKSEKRPVDIPTKPYFVYNRQKIITVVSRYHLYLFFTGNEKRNGKVRV